MNKEKLIEIKNRMLSHNFQLGVMLATSFWLFVIAIYHLTN